jgi:hypothetical protein
MARMHASLAALAVALWCMVATSCSAQHVVRPQDYGGIGDGKHNDTTAVLKRSDTCMCTYLLPSTR